MAVRRGDVWLVRLGDEPVGSEPAFERPALVVQDDLLNETRLGTVMVVPVTSNLELGQAMGNVRLTGKTRVVDHDSVVVVSQVMALDRSRFLRRLGGLTTRQMQEVNRGLALALGLSPTVG